MASPQVRFTSESDADSAYYGGGGGSDPSNPDNGGGTPDGQGKWSGTLEEDGRYETGFARLYEDANDGSRRRWFVGYAHDNGQYGPFIEASGSLYKPKDGDGLNSLPSFESSSAADSAHTAWVEANADDDGNTPNPTQDGDGPGSSGEWGEWQDLKELPYGWFLFGRTHSNGEDVQFVVAGQNSNGTSIYLAKDGSIAQEPVLFPNIDEVKAALSAYASNQGNIPEGQRPTGSGPSKETVTQQVRESSSTTSTTRTASKVVEKVKSNPALFGAAALVGYAVVRESGGVN